MFLSTGTVFGTGEVLLVTGQLVWVLGKDAGDYKKLLWVLEEFTVMREHAW